MCRAKTRGHCEGNSRREPIHTPETPWRHPPLPPSFAPSNETTMLKTTTHSVNETIHSPAQSALLHSLSMFVSHTLTYPLCTYTYKLTHAHVRVSTLIHAHPFALRHTRDSLASTWLAGLPARTGSSSVQVHRLHK
eukprot:GHVU01117269.1.p1 GENE.GHVU01117269.1~~GHVU01117269.1.p1  ORF type:complete len:136 (-),score=3.77 GHVU01117269.1:70-477(-)